MARVDPIAPADLKNQIDLATKMALVMQRAQVAHLVIADQVLAEQLAQAGPEASRAHQTQTAVAADRAA